MVRRIRNTLEDLYLGLKGEFPTLEEALTHPDSERKLISLARPTKYNVYDHTIRYRQDGKTHVLPLNPAFKDYMRRYRQNTHYVTDNGTPWLTRMQEGGKQISQKQLNAYYTALRAGENRDIVMVNWENTQGTNPGHSSMSVGSLTLSENRSEKGDSPIYDYTPEITGSYYGSTTPFLGMRHWDEYMRDSKVRKAGKNNPLAHAVGTTLRDGAIPIATFVSGAMLALASDIYDARKNKSLSEKQINAIAKRAIKYLTAATAIGASTAASGLLASSKGTLLMKEENDGSGILATLITPAQRDILEHSLYGIYQTYYGKYNILSYNCADFTQDMLKEIKVDLAPLIEQAMQIDSPKTFVERVGRKASIQQPIRPSRPDWMVRTIKEQIIYGTAELPRNPEGEQKRIDRIRSPKKAERLRKELDRLQDMEGDEQLQVIPVEELGQSTVLIKTPKPDAYFRQPPIETFRDVMKNALTLEKDPEGKCHFTFQPHIKIETIQPTRGAAR